MGGFFVMRDLVCWMGMPWWVFGNAENADMWKCLYVDAGRRQMWVVKCLAWGSASLDCGSEYIWDNEDCARDVPSYAHPVGVLHLDRTEAAHFDNLSSSSLSLLLLSYSTDLSLLVLLRLVAASIR